MLVRSALRHAGDQDTFVLLFTSRIALVLAVLPSVLMATDWATGNLQNNRAMAKLAGNSCSLFSCLEVTPGEFLAGCRRYMGG